MNLKSILRIRILSQRHPSSVWMLERAFALCECVTMASGKSWLEKEKEKSSPVAVNHWCNPMYMSVPLKNSSDHVCRGMMSSGMVSDTEAVQTHFTVMLQLFCHSTTTWRAGDIASTFTVNTKHRTGLAGFQRRVRLVITVLSTHFNSGGVSLISVGASAQLCFLIPLWRTVSQQEH